MRRAPMELVYGPFGRDEWTQLIAGLSPETAPQTAAWAEAKAATGPWVVERCAIVDAGHPIGAAQALVRRVPIGRGGLVFINRGPLVSNGVERWDALGETVELLRRYWVDDRGMVLRVAPPLRVERASAPAHFTVTAPGWSSMEIDLSRSDEDLRRSMKQKWRNCLYKAERLDTRVRTTSDSETFERFLTAYGYALVEKRLRKSTGPEFLRALNDRLPPHEKLVVHEALHADEAVAWAMVFAYGRRAEYIAAATTPVGRSVNAGQLLVWHAIKHARARGAGVFDLGGVDPAVRDSGVAHFKAGVGGRHYRLMPEIEAHRGGLIPSLVRWRIGTSRRATEKRSTRANRSSGLVRRHSRAGETAARR